VEITAPTSVAPPAAEAAPAPAPGAEPPSGDLVFVEPPVVPTLHRERETSRLLDLLQTQTARIACVVGDPGAGRTALLASLATALPDAPVTPVSVPPAGPGLGAWIEAIHKRAPREVPIVLDGCPGLGQEGADGASQLLAAARAGRRWILAATPQDVRRIEGVAPELAVNLEKVSLSPLSPEALVEVLDAGLGRIAEVAGVDFAPDVCRALVRLASRYPSESALPGRALTIAELAAARVGRRGGRLVGEEDVAHVVAEAAELPPERLLRTDDERFRTLEQRLAERVVGHDDARARIADVLRRSYAGFRGRRPLASFLLLGPTGVGKTETARAIADALFDGESALVRIDLSEYNEPHSVARLVGSPPGYVGYEEGGQLTEALRRRPACVVLLDELEKAHKEVLLLLLQVLEDGRLTDGRGRTVDFSAAAIVMTSNLGSELYRQKRAPSVATIQALARSRLPPELWNRIDEVLCFGPLGEAQLARVVARFARESSRRLEQERGISYRVEEPVIQAVLAAEPDRSLGARPLRRAFERLVEGPLAAQILAGQIRKGARLVLARSSTGQLLIGADG
jgi:ATP-dependent Clp protease ATP-binding subunit ClpC